MLAQTANCIQKHERDSVGADIAGAWQLLEISGCSTPCRCMAYMYTRTPHWRKRLPAHPTGAKVLHPPRPSG